MPIGNLIAMLGLVLLAVPVIVRMKSPGSEAPSREGSELPPPGKSRWFVASTTRRVFLMLSRDLGICALSIGFGIVVFDSAIHYATQMERSAEVGVDISVSLRRQFWRELASVVNGGLIVAMIASFPDLRTNRRYYLLKLSILMATLITLQLRWK
jgi:hypothetical protein